MRRAASDGHGRAPRNSVGRRNHLALDALEALGQAAGRFRGLALDALQVFRDLDEPRRGVLP